jgi:hypothetical protein
MRCTPATRQLGEAGRSNGASGIDFATFNASIATYADGERINGL